jgi:glycosyltransferase involved in cell wall biosynthesis
MVLLFYLGWTYDNFHPMVTMTPTIVRAAHPSARIVTMISDVNAAKPGAIWSRIAARLQRLPGRLAADPTFGTLLSQSDRVVLTSQNDRLFLEARHPEAQQRMTVSVPPVLIRRATEPDAARRAVRERLGIPEDGIVLIFLGYLWSSKGLETLFPALAVVLRSVPRDIRLLMVGDVLDGLDGSWYADVVRGICEAVGLSEHTYWMGGFEHDSDFASQHLYAADVGVFPFDGGIHLCNTSVAAAAVHGLPIVGTRHPWTDAELLEDDGALLVEPKDRTALAGALRAVVEDAELRQRLAAGATRLSKRHFYPGRDIVELDAVLKDAMAPRSRLSGRHRH